MTMRTASPWRTPCECIRKINDLFQGDSEFDLKVRQLCAEAEKGSKRYAQELAKHVRNADVDWFVKNTTFRSDANRRLKNTYKQEGSYR